MNIAIQAIHFSYPSGVIALRGISLQILSGEKVAIIGQNGSGKTTLVKHLNGLLKPSSGSVLIGDWDTRDVPVNRLASRVGYVFQNPDDQLFQSKVWAEVAFGPKNLGWEPARIEQQVALALEMVDLKNAVQLHPYDLSTGERKRVALASVLAMDTQIVVLDEPTTGEDYRGSLQIGQIVNSLHAQGKTVITITHDIDFCAEYFDRVIVMLDGQMLLDGSTRQVLSQAALLAETFVEPPQLIRLADRLGLDDSPLNVAEFTDSLLLKLNP